MEINDLLLDVEVQQLSLAVGKFLSFGYFKRGDHEDDLFLVAGKYTHKVVIL